MATETVISDHTSTDGVENETETVQQVIVSLSKETEGGKPKAEASPTPKAPFKSAGKEGDGRIEPSPIIREIVKTDDRHVVEQVKLVEQEMPSSEDEPKASESQTLEAPSPEAEGKMGDKQIEPPTIIIEADSPVLDSEVKPVEEETLFSVKETDEEKPKAAESQNLKASSPEAEEKVKDKQIEPSPVINEVEKADGSPVLDDDVKLVEQETFSSLKETKEENSKVEDVKAVEHETVSPSKETEEEKPKAAESQSLEATSSELEEKTGNKQIEPSPATEEFEKISNASVSDELKTIEKEITISPSKENKEEPRAGEAASSGLEEQKVDEQIESSPVSGEEVNIVEQETLSQCKETKEEKSKDEEVKTVEKEIVSLPQENEEEKPKDAESSSPEAPSEEKMVGLRADTSSIIREVENTLETPVLGVTVEGNSPAAKDSFPDAEILSAPEPAVQLVIESVEKQPDEKTKIDASSKSSVEAFKENEEPLEAFLVEESEAVVKETEGSEIGSMKAGRQNLAVPELEVEEKREEESEATEKVVTTEPEIEPKENREIELAKDKETLASEIEGATVLSEETKKDQEPFPCTYADQTVLINQEAQTDPTGDGAESSLPHVEAKEVMEVDKIKDQEAKNVETEDKNKDHVNTKELMQPKTLTVEDVSSSIPNAEVAEKLFEHNIAKTEEQKDDLISEMPTQTETKPDEAASSFLATTEVAEKLFEGENTSRVVEPISENNKGEALSSVEINKDGDEKLDAVTAADIVKQTTETSETELELKAEETAKGNTDDTGKEKEVNEAEKTGVPPESAKDCDDEKTPEDLPKQEVSTKPAHKQSNSILSKVKQSLVKAKKAITGKSSKSTQRDIKISIT